jgi:hypothetical protein
MVLHPKGRIFNGVLRRRFGSTGRFNKMLDNYTNSVAPEPEGSSPYSQEPVTGPYPEPAGSNINSPRQSP